MQKLNDFTMQTNGLFNNSLNEMELAMQGFIALDETIVNSNGTYSLEDQRKDGIDELLLQLLRDGASLGVYLIFTASRSGSIRMI